MKNKLIIFIFFSFLFINSGSALSEVEKYAVYCGHLSSPGHYLSVSKLFRNDSLMRNITAETEKSYRENGLGVVEDSVSTVRYGNGDLEIIRTKSKERFYSSDCRFDGELDFEDLRVWGLPRLFKSQEYELGSITKENINFSYRGRNVFLSISHEMEAYRKLFDKELLVFELRIQGVESHSENGLPAKWSGGGIQVFSAKEGYLFLNIMELKRDDGVRLSYSESFLY